MPAYHSSFNKTEAKQVCSMSILPIKTKLKGPSPVSTAQDEDVIDEAVGFFRANVLFRSYDIQGPADRVLLYLTFYIHQCLIRLANKDKDSGLRALQALSIEKFDIPGDDKFILGGMVTKPASSQEAELTRQLFTQLRQETGIRLCEAVFKENPKVASKWWLMWTKNNRKFLNKSLEGP